MTQDTPEVIDLRAGSTRLAVAPEVGGSITRYASERGGTTIEWMRPALADAIANRAAGGTSSFPMVPFSNRIRDAAFRFRGRTIQLPQNFRPEPHAIHGHAWGEPWAVLSQSETALTLEYRHPADAWPWTYTAQQAFDLTEERLRVRFTVTNEASEPMPVGFGLHPYFVRTPRATVRADVGRMWQADAGLMPVSLVPPPPQLLLDGAGLNPDAATLDNNFVGFGGQVVIDWPEWNARLRIDADPAYACLVVYTPAGQDFFCVEPATNCIDGFNLADAGRTDTGMIVLAPGDSAAGDVTFTPEVA
ncbi:MAG: aldose 1-epimerase [Acidobacteriota bacterium]|nr:aldose 1-epimerase [Acidobacteriota bacterium]